MRKLVFIVLLLVGCFGYRAYGQTGNQTQPKQVEVKPKAVDPALDVATLKIQNLQLKERLLQTNYEQLLSNLRKGATDEQQAIQVIIAKIKKENGWGDDVVYDVQEGKWFRVIPESKNAKEKK